MPSRNDQRRGFTDRNRIELLEQDMDEKDERDSSLSKMFFGLLISLAITSVAAAVNVLSR